MPSSRTLVSCMKMLMPLTSRQGMLTTPTPIIIIVADKLPPPHRPLCVSCHPSSSSSSSLSLPPLPFLGTPPPLLTSESSGIMMTSAGNTPHNNETVTSPLASRRVPYSLLFFPLSRVGTRRCPSLDVLRAPVVCRQPHASGRGLTSYLRDSLPRTFYLVRPVLIGKGAASCLGCRRYPGADAVAGMMILM